MKKAIKILIIAAFLTAPLFILAQNPPHPNNGNTPGSGNTPVGGGAPLAGGLFILISLGAGYGARKIFELRRKAIEEDVNV